MSWRSVRLRRLLFGTGGSWGTEPDDGEVVAHCIRGTDFDYSVLRTNSDRAPLRGFTAAEYRHRAARRGDLIIEKSGGGEQQPVGRVVLHDHDEPVVPTNFAARLRPTTGVDSCFANYLMASLYSDGRTKAAIKQTTGIQNLDLEALLAQEVMVPVFSEQRAITAFLDSEAARIDALITNKGRMIDLLDERKTSTMLAAVAGTLTHVGRFEPSPLEWLDERPTHWREALLRLVARTGSGHTPSRERPEWWLDCTIPWITTGEVVQVRSDEQEEISETRECIAALGLANSSATLHPPGTVVLCRTASAGYSAIMGRDMATSQDFATWTCGADLRPRYLLLCLRAMRADLLGRLAMGSTHKTIYMPDLHALRIPLPPVEEQDRIVGEAWLRLGSIFDASRRLKRQITLLQEHRQALITAAVTGELEVPGAAA